MNWSTLKDLHVIQKLREIMGKWFQVDVLFVDSFGRIQNEINSGSYAFNSYFLKVQNQYEKAKGLLGQDIESALNQLSDSSENYCDFTTSFPGVHGHVLEVIHEGTGLGYLFVYSFCKESLTASEKDTLMTKFLELGYMPEEAEMIVNKLPILEEHQIEYLKGLVSIFSDEITTYSQEIGKREERIKDLNSEVSNKYRYHSMIGKSKRMQEIYRLLEKISNSESTILVQGENGTGKELVAKAIHYNSPRKDRMFIAQNCSAFNDNLLDSELFGHVKGAFTGAVKDKKGLFEVADGGTLFLDEIGDTSLTMQVKLLRVLQEGTFLPVGATQPKKVNVRVIAATNKPLKDMIAKGDFREDLYYRINVINVQLPPLRDRKEDIPLLIEHFLEKKCAEKGYELKTFSKKCMEKVLDHTWPGNIRELENEVERLVVLAGDEKVITPDMLSGRILEKVGAETGLVKGINTNGSLKEALEELEIIMIREGLKRTNFNKSRLAKELGISRAGLIMKVDKYGLDKRKKVA